MTVPGSSPLRSALRSGIAASALLAAAAFPAAAQYYGPGYPAPNAYNLPPPPPGIYRGRPYDGDEVYAGPRAIPPRVVVERLEDQGFEDVGRPRFTGTLYIVDATAPGDIRMRLVVDAVRGIVLDRKAIGEPRRFDLRSDDDDEDRAPQRRYTGRPIESVPDAPARRDGPRYPDVPPQGGLSTPADPRLAPEAARPGTLDTRPQERQATRTPPPIRPRAEPESNPSGMNPGMAVAPKPKPKPAEQARIPDQPATERPVTEPKDMARRPVPAADKPVANRPVQGEASTADASRAGGGEPKKPVRVIGGVTPMATDKPADAPPAAPAPAAPQ